MDRRSVLKSLAALAAMPISMLRNESITTITPNSSPDHSVNLPTAHCVGTVVVVHGWYIESGSCFIWDGDGFIQVTDRELNDYRLRMESTS